MLRLAEQDSTLPNGAEVPKGTVVSISPYLTHHDSTIYQSANSWRPERFLEEPGLPKALNSDGKVGFLPFGAGVHRCPGERFAGLIASVAIGTLLRDYEIMWPEGQESQELSALDFNKLGTPWSKKDIWVQVRKR